MARTKYELDRYLTFALSQRQEKYNRKTLERVTKTLGATETKFWLDIHTLLMTEKYHPDKGYSYFDALGCKIILE